MQDQWVLRKDYESSLAQGVDVDGVNVDSIDENDVEPALDTELEELCALSIVDGYDVASSRCVTPPEGSYRFKSFNLVQ